MIAAVNGGTLIPGLILGLVIGLVIMRATTGFVARYGRPPWGIPAWGWFLFGFILGVIGAILYLIAQATTKRQVQGGAGVPPPYPPPPMSPQTWATPTGPPRAVTESPGPMPPPPPPPPSDPYPYPAAGPTEPPPTSQ